MSRPVSHKLITVLAALALGCLCVSAGGASSVASLDSPPGYAAIDVAIPLSDDDRLPDFDTPAAVLRLLPQPSVVGPETPDALLDRLIANGAPADSDADAKDRPAARANIAGSPPRRRHTIFAAPGATLNPASSPLPRLIPIFDNAPQPSPETITFIAGNSAADATTAPAPRSINPTPVEFAALLDEDGNVIIESPDPDSRRDLIIHRGRFELGRLELGRTITQLELDGAQFAVADGVDVMPNGRIVTHVRGAPAGLDFSADAVIDINRGARIVLFFHAASTVEGIHWGMRSTGDRRDEFRRLIVAGRIVVGQLHDGLMIITKAVIIFDGEYTYITIDYPKFDNPVNTPHPVVTTVVPEPAGITLLGLGGLALLKRRRASAVG